RFTENESNLARLWGVPNPTQFVKDSINDAVVQDRPEIVNSNQVGTKAAAHYKFTMPPNESRTIRLHLTKIDNQRPSDPFAKFDKICHTRREEADELYSTLAPPSVNAEHRAVQAQALSGFL